MTTSVVTLLVTDLVGSTALRTRVGEDRFDEIRAEHDRLLRDQVTTHHGEVAKHTGDGMIAVFTGASDAVSAAESIQRAVERRNRHAVDPFQVRIPGRVALAEAPMAERPETQGGCDAVIGQGLGGRPGSHLASGR